MKPLLFFNKVYNKLSKGNLKLSFSQCGEDSILLFIIQALKLEKVQYFDVGTNHPRNMNNTYLLYLNNFRGICIEPDPAFHKSIKRHRPGDILIPGGVAVTEVGGADFYVMDDPLLNTFSALEAERLVKTFNRKIRKKIKVDLVSLNAVFEKYFALDTHHLLSLDVEGLDLPILQSINFEKYRPAIICVESIEFSDNLSGKKNTEITDLLTRRGYQLYADTYINSIFVDANLLKAVS